MYTSYEAIYKGRRENGATAKQSAQAVLDILTNGTWAAWDEPKINGYLVAIIKKFEGGN